MTRFLVFVLLSGITALGMETSSTPVPADQTQNVTFDKDVLPILQNNCQTCHRPGGIAPMSLLTYESARPWAKAIKTAVVNKQMPPWFADPHYGEFRNAPKLTENNIRTIVAWSRRSVTQAETGRDAARVRQRRGTVPRRGAHRGAV